MISLTEKQTLLQELEARLRSEYETLRAAQRATVEGATHEEAKPENDKDTRALEQTYLARGQAQRVVQLENDLNQFSQLRARSFDEATPVGFTAVVRLLNDEDIESLFLLVPAGAGEELDSSLGRIKVVTPQAPLGRLLMGAHLDDDLELRTPKGRRTLSAVGIG